MQVFVVLLSIFCNDFTAKIKETSYYHPWNENGKISNQRVFGITMANSSYENLVEENKFSQEKSANNKIPIIDKLKICFFIH